MKREYWIGYKVMELPDTLFIDDFLQIYMDAITKTKEDMIRLMEETNRANASMAEYGVAVHEALENSLQNNINIVSGNHDIRRSDNERSNNRNS